MRPNLYSDRLIVSRGRASLARLVAAVVSLCVAVGCVAPVVLSPQGQQVQVSDEQIVRECQYIGDVNGDSTDTETARNDARNRAATLGATNVVFVSQSNAVITGRNEPNTPANTLGRAYRCPTGAAPSPPPTSRPVAPAE